MLLYNDTQNELRFVYKYDGLWGDRVRAVPLIDWSTNDINIPSIIHFRFLLLLIIDKNIFMTKWKKYFLLIYEKGCYAEYKIYAKAIYYSIDNYWDIDLDLFKKNIIKYIYYYWID